MSTEEPCAALCRNSKGPGSEVADDSQTSSVFPLRDLCVPVSGRPDGDGGGGIEHKGREGHEGGGEFSSGNFLSLQTFLG